MTAIPFPPGGVLSPPITPDDFRRLLEQLREAISTISKTVNHLCQQLRNAVTEFLDFLTGAIDRLIKMVQDLGKRLTDLLLDILRSPGWPFDFFGVADVWIDRIYKPADTALGLLVDPKASMVNYWQGNAADTYNEHRSVQTTALMQLRDISNDVASNLRDTGFALATYLIAIVAAVASYIVECVAEAAVDATGIGAPAGVLAWVASTFKVLALIGAIMGAYFVLFSQMYENAKDLEPMNFTESHLKDGHFPVLDDLSRNVMADSTNTDNSPSQWSLRHEE